MKRLSMYKKNGDVAISFSLSVVFYSISNYFFHLSFKFLSFFCHLSLQKHLFRSFFFPSDERIRKLRENRFCAWVANYLWILCKFSIKFQYPINYLIRSRFNVSWELWPFAWLSFQHVYYSKKKLFWSFSVGLYNFQPLNANASVNAWKLLKKIV